MEHLSSLFELATAYHACRNVDTLLKSFASQLASRVGARAVLVWLFSDTEDEKLCRGRWSEAGVVFEPSPEPVTEGLLVDMLEATRAQRLSARQIKPDRLIHLAENDRERVKSALYAPIPGPKGVAGVVEVLNKKSGDFSADDAAFVEEASRLTGRALDSARAIEQERHSRLVTIERLTALYDISRTFNSTLELEDLLPIIAEKIRDILGAEACNLWLVDSEAHDLYFAQQAGEDPTTSEDDRFPLGEGVPGQVAQRGEAMLVENAQEEPLLAPRQQASKVFKIDTLMCAPLLKDEEVLGVVEVVNKLEGDPFGEDDLFFLGSISEQAAIALNNANLLEAERKVHELDALLAISKEITSTLNLDRVLLTVVNQASTVLPFDRCTIGLFDRGRFILNAVSGLEAVPKTEEMESLRRLLEWVAQQDKAVSADKGEQGWEVEPKSGQEYLVPYLERVSYRGFYALPLTDEQGTLGVIALESAEEGFLSESHLELLSILASQTTVAIRNAQLYQQVPLINVMQPLLERKAKLMALPRARLKRMGLQALALALFLVIVPWKMRISTNAIVVPAERRAVAAQVEGVIQRVFVREGEAVDGGTVLAELDASDNRVSLERAQTNLALTRRQLAEAEAQRELGDANQARLRMQMHQAEVALFRDKVEKARLRSPGAGVIVTPKVEEKVGQLLEKGELFCELVNAEQLAVEMNVPETNLDLIRPGAQFSLKLNAFPTRTFSGRVERVGAQAVAIEGDQYFVVRATFANPDLKARTGMVGRAKIGARGGWGDSGWYPIGYVLLRSPARWGWRKVWTWLP
ncbi:MAG: GAF domain-containing protein [Candidatus Acidoferrales bacterium]